MAWDTLTLYSGIRLGCDGQRFPTVMKHTPAPISQPTLRRCAFTPPSSLLLKGFTRTLNGFPSPPLYTPEMEAVKAQVVAEYEECKAVYFTALLTAPHHCYQLEIPLKFTKRTGWPGAGDCNLITAKRNSQSWPVTFQQSSSSSGTVAWTSYGGGYGRFLSDNKIALPTLLVLEQVDDVTLVVVIHRDETSPPKKVLPPPKFEEDPWWHFQKTLRACHTRPSKSTRLDIPTPYWRTVGDSRFDGPWYTLQGPLETVMVKSARYYSNSQTFCYFTKGWVDFVALNKLKLGDTILFAEKGDSEFEVRKL